MQLAKIHTGKNEQTVRLPREFHIEGEDIIINKVGDALILMPVSRAQAVYQHGLESFTSDFLAEGRPEQHSTVREEL